MNHGLVPGRRCSGITVTSGCTEAIAATLLGLLNPGDEIILFEPYYDAYKAAAAGLTVVTVAGTDELHVAGDWRQVWDEGTGLADMKVKTTPRTGEPVVYTATLTTGTGTEDGS
jgi:aspartate/methionine/tyrosine aminotransferase